MTRTNARFEWAWHADYTDKNDKRKRSRQRCYAKLISEMGATEKMPSVFVRIQQSC